MENVRGTVREIVEAVQHAFDLHHQMEQHPWLMLGGSLLVGYLLGSRGNGRTAAVGSAYEPRFSPASSSPVSSSESLARPQSQQRAGSGVLERVKDEIAIIEGEAVRAVVSTLWGVIKQALLPPTPPLTNTRTKQGSQSSDWTVQTPVAMSSTAINGSAIF